MRRPVSAALLAVCLALLASPAGAQPYPPATGGLALSDSTVAPGEPVTLTGSGAAPGSTVTVTLAGVTGVDPIRTEAGPDGAYEVLVRLPAGLTPGSYTIVATSSRGVLGTAILRVRVSVGGGTGLSRGIGGLPFTGADVLPGLTTGVLLIVAGGVVLLSIRRRSPA
jgi:hypothetical protein